MPRVAMKGGIFNLAMKGAGERPAEQRQRAGRHDADGHRQAQIGQQDARNDGAEGHQRADRKIDAAGDDDQRRRDGQHAVDRGCLQDGVMMFAGLHEVGRGER